MSSNLISLKPSLEGYIWIIMKELIGLGGLILLLEKKGINILIGYIFIAILTGVAISLNSDILRIDGLYLTYILILVQISALTIIFGFLIMLYPVEPLVPLKHTLFFTITYILSLFLYMYGYTKTIPSTTVPFHLDDILHLPLIHNIGEYFYNDPSGIFKIFILTLILLLAIIALFYIL